MEEENDLNPLTLPYFIDDNYIRFPDEHHDYICSHEYI